MIKNIENYKWLLLSSFFSALTIIIIKYYDSFKNNWFLLVALLSECGLIYSYIHLLEVGNILIQFSLVKIIAILLVAIPSILLAWTELTTSRIFGIIFGIIAIYLLK